MNDKFPDVISTATLLLAIVTALMGFWYADVSKALGEDEPNLANEKKTVVNRIKPVFRGKALPLAIGSTVVALIFVWRTIEIILEAIRSVGTGATYSDMKTAFVATEVLMIVLAVVSVSRAYMLAKKCIRLR
jgi:uncharacterized membrane protein